MTLNPEQETVYARLDGGWKSARELRARNDVLNSLIELNCAERAEVQGRNTTYAVYRKVE